MRLSRQRGGAWAHDCAVWDEEVAEDQDESGGHCGWFCNAEVASFLNGMLSEVESVCVCLQREVVWALTVVVVELVCEAQCVERWRKDCRPCLLPRDCPFTPHLTIARRCRIGGRPTSLSAIAATEHHPEGKHTPLEAVVCWKESDIVVV